MASDPDPFTDEPMLPQLPAQSQNSSGHISSSHRKRSYPFRTPGAEALPSSDLGFFSSDDDPGLDNYAQARQKRRYRGTWYDHNQMLSESDPTPNENDSHGNDEDVIPETPKAKARSGSSQDATASAAIRARCDPVHPPPTPPASNPALHHDFTPVRRFRPSHSFVSRQGFSPGQNVPSSQGFPSSQAVPSSQSYATEPARKQLAVKQAIERCIDNGESVIDLANSNLDDECISPEIFRPLIELKLVPRVQARVQAFNHKDPLTTSKDGYLHQESQVVLIMANNSLTRVPGTLFNIENLVNLSLRHNLLTELPAAIAQCKSLRSLNVSFNRLRHLPFEWVERLSQFDSFNFAGNDFYDFAVPEGWSWKPRTFRFEVLTNLFADPFDERTHGQRHWPWSIGRGPVQYSDTAGKMYSEFRIPSAGGRAIMLQDPDDEKGPLSRPPGERTRLGASVQLEATRVPSLTELCTRSISKLEEPEDLVDMTAGPEFLTRAVTAATKVKYNGGQLCAVCRKPFIFPRTQWVEFVAVNLASAQCESAGAGRPSPTPEGERTQLMQYSIDWPRPLPFFEEENLTDRLRRSMIPCLRSGCSWKCVPSRTGLRPGDLIGGIPSGVK